MFASGIDTNHFKILTPAIGIVAIGTLGLAPAVLSVAPASAATHSSSSSVRSGDYGGQATLKLPARPSVKMNLDDAYVSANQGSRVEPSIPIKAPRESSEVLSMGARGLALTIGLS